MANALTATLTDPDGVADNTPPITTQQTDLTTSATWKWERSRNGRTGWTEIEVVTDSNDCNNNPDANVYIPVEDDEGYFLRATASYDDGEGEDKTAEMVSYLAVRPIPYSNNTPVFRDAEGMEMASDGEERCGELRGRRPGRRSGSGHGRRGDRPGRADLHPGR